MVRSCPCLPLGRSCQRQASRSAGQAVVYLNRIPHCINIRVAGLIIMIHFNGAGNPNFQSGILCKLCLRPDSDGKHHRLSRNTCIPPPLPYNHLIIFNGGNRGIQQKLHAMVHQLFMEHLRHVVIKGCHDLIQPFNQGDILSGLF